MGKLTRTPGPGGAHRRSRRDQRGQRDRPGPVQRLPAGRRRRPGSAEPLGQRFSCRSSTSRRSSRRSPSWPAPSTPRPRSPTGCTRRSPWPARRTAVRCSSTSPWTSSSTPDRRARPTWLRPRHARAGRGRDLRDRRAARRRPPRPVLILGTDVWADGAEEAALRLVEETGIPVITNGMGRGVIPGGHPLLVTKARGAALGGADLVVVAGTPLDFRLGYGVFGGKDGATPARVVHLADSPGQVSQHADLAGSASGRPHAWCSTGCATRSRSAGAPARLDGLGDRACRTPSGRPPSATPSCWGRGRPDPPGPHLRRAGAPAGRGRGRDRRRRRLRVVRGQVRRAQASRRLARPGALRLPRRRPGRGDRRPARASVRPGRAAATATAPPACR